MSDPSTVNSQLLSAISATQRATMDPTVVRVSGAGKAYQSVAQSAAIAVQDAADYLRNVGTISTTAIGVAMSQIIASDGAQGTEALTQAQNLMTNAISNFEKVGDAAANLANKFPSG